MVGDSSAAIIGKSVTVRGEVRGNEDLVIDGLVEGLVTLSDSRLTVGAEARVQADLAARDIIVLGQVNGALKATGRVELRQGSHVTGDIQAARLSIEDDAIFHGKVDLLQGASKTSSENSPQTVSVVPRSE